MKLIGFAVLAIMVLSLAGLSLEAMNQAVQDEAASGNVQVQQYQFTVGSADDDAERDDTATLQTLKFVCPFH